MDDIKLMVLIIWIVVEALLYLWQVFLSSVVPLKHCRSTLLLNTDSSSSVCYILARFSIDVEVYWD